MDKVKLNGRDKFKGRWDGTNFSFERDRSYGFSWPQRNYNCNFCKKEFKSAQALGGHMNVHRRDRAKQLTQHSSSSSSSEINASHLHPNPNPKPNPNHDKLLPPPQQQQQPTSARFFPYMATTHPNFNYQDHDALTVSPQIREIRQKLAVEAKCQYEFKSRKKNKDDVKSCDEAARVHTKKSTADHQYLKLDSNMITASVNDGKEDLDLELRLGN